MQAGRLQYSNERASDGLTFCMQDISHVPATGQFCRYSKSVRRVSRDMGPVFCLEHHTDL